MDQLILFGSAVLLVRVGLALYGAGVLRAKNSAGAVLRVACDLFAAVLAFWAIGAAILLQSSNGVFDVNLKLLFLGSPGAGAVLFLAVIVSLAPGAVAGAAGERSKFFPLLAVSVLLAAIVVPVTGHWAWLGWLAQRGFTDAGGASFIHMVGGTGALIIAILLGPRNGKYHRDGSVSLIPGHNLPMAGAGVLLILTAWISYIGGCTGFTHGDLEMASLNVLLAASAGGLVATCYTQARYGKPDVLLAYLGILGALVAISGGAGVLTTPWAVLTGAVAGVLVPVSSIWIDRFGRVDDPGGSVAIHLIGGAWGTLATGLFAAGTMQLRLRHLGIQALGGAIIAGFAAICLLVVLLIVKKTVGLRASEADEFDGLDLAQHDIGAYPDFQQNTIRSYHLRET